MMAGGLDEAILHLSLLTQHVKNGKSGYINHYYEKRGKRWTTHYYSMS